MRRETLLCARVHTSMRVVVLSDPPSTIQDSGVSAEAQLQDKRAVFVTLLLGESPRVVCEWQSGLHRLVAAVAL